VVKLASCGLPPSLAHAVPWRRLCSRGLGCGGTLVDSARMLFLLRGLAALGHIANEMLWACPRRMDADVADHGFGPVSQRFA